MDISGLLNTYLYSPEAWSVYDSEPQFQNEVTYRFRRQFLVGPRPADQYQSWTHLKVRSDLHITAHPDLPLNSTRRDNRTLVIIGYALDPYHPERNDLEIARDLIEHSTDAASLSENARSLSGRFVLLLETPENSILLPDPGALRQIFFTQGGEELWAGSSSALISTVTNCPVWEELIGDMNRTPLFKTADFWLPGSLTYFRNVRHLQPNHYLDLSEGRTRRFWPQQSLKPLSLSEQREQAALLLRGIFDAAVRRFPLAMGLSSGLDSRMLLAASRYYSSELEYFTMVSEQSRSSHYDAAAASELLEQLRIPHRVIALPRTVPEKYSSFLEQSIHMHRPVKALNSYALFRNLSLDENNTAVVWGNLAEITKRDRSRWPEVHQMLLSPGYLSLMALMNGSTRAKEEFSAWLKEAKRCCRHNVCTLDLLHWEHRVGSWAAGSLSEYDTAFESLCPYNCREYLELFLRVPFRFRTKPHYRAHTELIRQLWPETLKMPIGEPKEGISGTAIDLMYKSGTYDYLKFCYIQTVRRIRKSA
ncbi:MAG: hypothetical protein ACLFVE_05055 [Chitinispirillaceae bacterium]